MLTKQLLINEIHELPENLKEDVWQYITQLKNRCYIQKTATPKTLTRPFKVRQFHLGTDINPDRAELYTAQNQHVCD